MYSKFTSPPIVSAALRPRQKISSGQQMAAMQKLTRGSEENRDWGVVSCKPDISITPVPKVIACTRLRLSTF